MKKEPREKVLMIGDRAVGGSNPVFIIAEAGVNHNGKLALAKKLVDIAVESNADAVKFQMRDFSTLYTKKAFENSSGEDIGTQYLLSLIRDSELSLDNFAEVADYARSKKIMFLCTPWDMRSVDVLEDMGVPAYKVASADLVNLELLAYIASKKKPMIVSTGMSTRDEIDISVAFLRKLKAQFVILHCNSSYPAAAKDLNLRFIDTLRRETGEIIGYSGHEHGLAATYATIPLGAKVIERHFTIDRTMVGPDHAISLEPRGLENLVRDIRRIEEALGTGKKYMTAGEFINRRNLGKSLVATQPISKGAKITREMITAKSPGHGVSPQKLFDLVGKKAPRDIGADEHFQDSDLGGSKIKKDFSSKKKWSLIVRPHDLEDVIAENTPPVVEFHFSSHDLDLPLDFKKHPNIEAIVHCPELWGDQLFDLCSRDKKVLAASIKNANRVLDAARHLRQYFGKTPEKIKVVVHPGGMSYENFESEDAKRKMYETLAQSLKKLDLTGIELLLENLPPFPWYKGGQWFSNMFMDAQEMFDFAKKEGYGLCYDSSHAQLWCTFAKKDPIEFFKIVKPLVRHMHISDGGGVDGEGLQIGEGDVPWKELAPLLKAQNASFSPEIWMGHRHGGEAFWRALNALKKLGM
jgi:sialic acid synthase SpsE/sugar phosphate isomerase/epimerase